jgi:hypothetical protein
MAEGGLLRTWRMNNYIAYCNYFLYLVILTANLSFLISLSVFSELTITFPSKLFYVFVFITNFFKSPLWDTKKQGTYILKK